MVYRGDIPSSISVIFIGLCGVDFCYYQYTYPMPYKHLKGDRAVGNRYPHEAISLMNHNRGKRMSWCCCLPSSVIACGYWLVLLDQVTPLPMHTASSIARLAQSVLRCDRRLWSADSYGRTMCYLGRRVNMCPSIMGILPPSMIQIPERKHFALQPPLCTSSD